IGSARRSMSTPVPQSTVNSDLTIFKGSNNLHQARQALVHLQWYSDQKIDSNNSSIVDPNRPDPHDKLQNPSHVPISNHGHPPAASPLHHSSTGLQSEPSSTRPQQLQQIHHSKWATKKIGNLTPSGTVSHMKTNSEASGIPQIESVMYTTSTVTSPVQHD
ncbi:hypothetical protein ACLOJK_036723, partial [Asimina triloba]